ncbi:hypothetical protein D3C86_2033670 [compost metagenome]
MGLGHFSSLPDLLWSCTPAANPDVISNRAPEENRLLRDYPHSGSKALQRNLLDVHAIQENTPLL